MSEKYSKILSGVVATLAAAAMAFTSTSLMSCTGGNSSGGGTDNTTTTTNKNEVGDVVDKNSQPNIVFILLDDTGVTDFGCYGNKFNETPNIDRVASEGTRFTSYYTQPVCSPSRSCAMTGQGTLRTGISNFLDAQNSVYLDNEEFTLLPQMLNDAGYHTGMIGKWHLCSGYANYPTNGSPYDAGFDEVILSEQKYIGGGDYFYPYNHIPQYTDGKNGDFLVDTMNEAAVDYIEKAAESDEPFFLYLSHYATHTTLDAPAATLKYFQQKRGTNGDKGTRDRNPYLAAMLKHIDDGVGAIDKTLERLGIKDNTVVVIASDNGGSLEFTDNGSYRGGKSQLYEGGLKDPLIIRWPNATNEARVTDFPVSVIDLYQTFGEAAGLDSDKVPENSGTSLWPLVLGTGTPDRDTLYWAFLRQTNLTENTNVTYNTQSGGGVAIRCGDYKYIESVEYYRRELYNIAKDPGETKNIIDDNLELADTLARKLHSLLAADTVGKKFNASFASDEYYRWNTSGTMAKAGGQFSASATALSVVTREDLLMYDIDMSAKVKVGASGSAGLLFRSTLSGPNKTAFTAYAVAISAENQTVSLVNLKNQTSYVIDSAPCAVSANKAYTLRLVADGDEIKVYLDGNQVATFCDELYFHGSVGFYSNLCSATFDDLKVTGIEGKRAKTAVQMNSKPDKDVNVNVDYRWLPSGAVTENGVLYVNAQEFAKVLGMGYEVKDNGIIINNRTKSFEFTANSKTVGNKEMSNAPIVKDGALLIPITDVTSLLGLSAETTSSLIKIKTADIEVITHTSNRITYSGTWSDLGDTKRSSEKDAYAQLTFEGCGVKLYLNRGDYACIFEVYIDGVLVDTIDSYNATALSRSLMFQTDDLDMGTHTIKIVNTGTCRQGGKGTNLNITAFEILKAPSDDEDGESSGGEESKLTSTKVTMNDPSITYVGTWTVAGETKRSKVAGEYCEYTFEGVGVDLYMGVGAGAGIFEVYIDGVLVDTIDPYQTAAATLLKFSSEELENTSHTIKLVNTGTKNPSGIATNMNLAYFIIYSTNE